MTGREPLQLVIGVRLPGPELIGDGAYQKSAYGLGSNPRVCGFDSHRADHMVKTESVRQDEEAAR